MHNVKYNRLQGPTLRQFYNHWNGLFTRGDRAKVLWQRYMHSAMPSVSNTRWWSREELFDFLLGNFKLPSNPLDLRKMTLPEWVEKVFNEDEKPGKHLTWVYKALVCRAPGYDPVLNSMLIMELAVTVDVSLCLRNTTYNLEGDGVLALFVKDVLDTAAADMRMRFPTMDYLNVQELIATFVTSGVLPRRANIGVAGLLADDGDGVAGLLAVNELVNIKQVWVDHCKYVSERCIAFFNEKVMGHSKIRIFEAAALCNPDYMRRVGPHMCMDNFRLHIQPLVDESFISQGHVEPLVGEIVQYQAVCRGENWSAIEFHEQVKRPVFFWMQHKSILPAWCKLAHACFYYSPHLLVWKELSVYSIIFTTSH